MQNRPPTFANLVIMSVALHLSIAIYVFVAFFLEKSAGWTGGWSAPVIFPYAAAALLLQFIVGPIFGKMYRR